MAVDLVDTGKVKRAGGAACRRRRPWPRRWRGRRRARPRESPRAGGLAGWIDGAGRRTGHDARPGRGEGAGRAHRRLRQRGRRRAPLPDADRVDGARQARALPRGGPITVDDVRALVAEAVPGSVWAFVDAVGQRRRGRALELLERLIETTPAPVLLAVLHRRLRELIEARTGSSGRARPAFGAMRLQPFRARRSRSGAGVDRPSWTRRWTAWSSSMRRSRGSAGGPDGGARRWRSISVIDQAVGDRRRRLTVSRRSTRRAPGGRGRSRSRRRSGRARDRAARSGPGRCTAGGNRRTGRRGCRSTAARSGRAAGTSCRTGSRGAGVKAGQRSRAADMPGCWRPAPFPGMTRRYPHPRTAAGGGAAASR